MQRVKVLVTIPEMDDRPEFLDEIASVSPRLEIEHRVCRDADEVAGALTDAEILYSYRAPAHLDDANMLKWVTLHYAGIDSDVDSPIFDKDRRIVVTNVAGAHAIPMAEYAITVMAMLARNFMQLVRDKASRTYDSTHSPPAELWGRTVGVVGYGHIGRETGRLAHAHGMRVVALKRDAAQRRASGFQWDGVGDPEGAYPDRFFGPDELHDLLSESDFVVNCLPLTPGTRGLFGEPEFKAMRKTAYFLNIGRGATVQIDALAEAARTGEIAGAGLDDFEHRTIPPESPLWDLDNVFVSPHISGTRRNVEYLERTNELFCENLRRYLNGEPLYNVVTREQGY